MNRYKSRTRLRYSFPCINKRCVAPRKYIMHVNASGISTETMYRFNNGRVLMAFRMFSATVYLWPRKLCAGADIRACPNDIYIGITYKYRYITDERVNM